MREGHASSARQTTVLSLIGALAVVIAFLTVTVVAQHYATVIDGMANTLATNAMPSIDHLTAARGALHQSGIAARGLAAGQPDRSRNREALDRARSALDREVAGYLELPFFSGEHALAHDALKDIGAYEKALDKLAVLVDSTMHDEARTLLAQDVAPLNQRVDADLERLVRVNADQAGHTSHAIERARIRATQVSYLLHGLAGALGVLVLWGVARVRGSYERALEARARLEEERKRFAEERAAEIDMFAARVAHDLKNPLAAATLAASLLDKQLDDPARAGQTLGRIRRAHRAMQRIIDGLLAFSRAAHQPDRSSTDLGAVLNQAVADVAPALDVAGATVAIDEGRNIRVACAEGPLLSVLENLLGNAAKYILAVPPDARRIQVRILDGREVVRVEVDDTGPGIPPEAQRDIFNPYVRGRNTTQPGLGLGLATVKRVVEAHGGAVGVRSVVGAGSCFWFELPRAAPTAENDPRLQVN